MNRVLHTNWKAKDFADRRSSVLLANSLVLGVQSIIASRDWRQKILHGAPLNSYVLRTYHVFTVSVLRTGSIIKLSLVVSSRQTMVFTWNQTFQNS